MEKMDKVLAALLGLEVLFLVHVLQATSLGHVGGDAVGIGGVLLYGVLRAARMMTGSGDTAVLPGDGA